MQPIKTARHLHGVATPQAYEARQRQMLADTARRAGDPPVEPWRATRPLVARINDGFWIGDCDCGSGVGVEPAWPVSRCFSCGAVYTRIVLPDTQTRLNIEHILAQRPRAHQHWFPEETELQLAIENAEHGVRF